MKDILRNKHIILLSIILLVGFYLRVDGIDFGLPLLFNRDEPKIIDNAIHIVETGDLNPHFFWHPSLMIYLAAIIYRMLLLLDGLGLLHASSVMLYLLVRFSSVVFGTLTILIVYLIGEKLRDRNIGIIAALFLAVAPLHVEHSHYATIHVPVTFFITLGLFFCILAVKHGRMRHYVSAGVSTGLAASTSYVGGLLMVPLFIAFLLGRKILRKRDDVISARSYFVILFLPVLVYLVLNPYTLLDYDAFFEGFYKQQFGSITYEGVRSVGGDVPAWIFYLGSPLKNGMGYKLEILAILGLLVGILGFRKEEIILLCWTLLYYVTISLISLKHDRYMLPILPVLMLFASIMLLRIVNYGLSASKRYTTRIPAGAPTVFLLLVILAYPWNSYQTTLYRTLWANNFIFHEKDTRTIAFEWIENNIPAGSKIVRGDHTPDMGLSEREYSVLFRPGEDEFRLMLGGYNWLIENKVEYAVFSDAPQSYYGKMGYTSQIAAYFDELNEKGELIKIISPKGFEYMSTPIDLSPGENTIMFHSVGGCDIVSDLEGKDDVRCLSIGLRNISLINLDTKDEMMPPYEPQGENTTGLPTDYSRFVPRSDSEAVFRGVLETTLEGWFDPEEGSGRTWSWMGNNGTVLLYNPANESVDVKVAFRGGSFHKNRTLDVFLGNELHTRICVDVMPWFMEWTYFLPVMRLVPGENRLMLSTDGCDVPSEVDPTADDGRCLSIYVEDIRVLGADELSGKVLYESYWWEEEEHEGVRWMSQNGTVTVHNPLNYTIHARLGFEIGSYHKNRVLEVFTNARLIGRYDIPKLYNRPGPTIWIYKIHSRENS